MLNPQIAESLLYINVPSWILLGLGWLIVDRLTQKRDKKKQFVDDLRAIQDKAEEICHLKLKEQGQHFHKEAELALEFGLFRARLLSFISSMPPSLKNAIKNHNIKEAIIVFRQSVTGDSLFYSPKALGDAFYNFMCIIEKIKTSL
jgi:hypothetical protein